MNTIIALVSTEINVAKRKGNVDNEPLKPYKTEIKLDNIFNKTRYIS